MAVLLRCPFDVRRHPARRCFTTVPARLNSGRCVQGNHTTDTHKDELCYAFDFQLVEGTPVLAAADGVVVTVVDCYRKGGRTTKEMRVMANYVALRHDDGLYSRYYHLCHNGACVEAGDRVSAGSPIGRSGSTGFSGGPHLHFDVVDVLPTDMATLALSPTDCGTRLTAQRFQCVPACFSARLPPADTPLRAPVMWADPATASEPELHNASQLHGAIALLLRCPNVDFIDKVMRAEMAGAVAAVVVSNDSVAAPFTMGLAKAKGVRRVGIPAVMISHRDGVTISAAINAAQKGASGLNEWPAIILGCSSHFRPRYHHHADGHAAGDAGNRVSDFVPITQPVRFLWPGHKDGYMPELGRAPPASVQSITAAQ